MPKSLLLVLLGSAVIAICASLLPPVHAAPAPAPRRIAILVGANMPAPGRQPLLYAHRDAENMAEVLQAVGRFEAGATTVLRDPSPAEVVQNLERAVAAIADQPGAVLYFYYSGHADERALYPRGEALPVEKLRRYLDDPKVAVRVGMVDACRGGGWTRAKGLAPAPAFAVNWPLRPTSEGSVLISSSSGLESAHESDQLQASFFTYHFAAGLRGAADKSGNGEVSLSEAFDYAKEQTIRDTVRQGREAQHPSYAVNLRGRNDLVLGLIGQSPSVVTVDQVEGPLELIHAESGVTLLDLPPGSRRLRLAVPPGRYLVRRISAGQPAVKEITVAAGGDNRIEERELVLVASSRLAVKDAGGSEPGLRGGTLPARTIAIQAAVGMTGQMSIGTHIMQDPTGTYEYPNWVERRTEPAGFFDLLWGLTDRLTWRIGTLGFAYRSVDTAVWQVIPAGGMVAWRQGLGEGFASIEGRYAAALAVRRWLGEANAFSLSLEVSGVQPLFKPWAEQYESHLALGYSRALGPRAALHIGAAWQRALGQTRLFGADHRLFFGAVQSVGLRQLPLFEVFLSRNWVGELHASLEYRPTDFGRIDYGENGFESGHRPRFELPIMAGASYLF